MNNNLKRWNSFYQKHAEIYALHHKPQGDSYSDAKIAFLEGTVFAEKITDMLVLDPESLLETLGDFYSKWRKLREKKG